MPSVLVIEDDTTIRNGLVRLLSNEGFTTVFTDNGKDGLRLAEAHSPDVIICDIAMPEMDGFAVLTSLRANPTFARTPIIMLSAKTATNDEERAMSLGATTFLKKPMWPDDIVEAIKKFV